MTGVVLAFVVVGVHVVSVLAGMQIERRSRRPRPR